MPVRGNAVYAQSGGVTSVINASAYGVIKAAMEAQFIDDIYAGLYGINGVLDDKLIDISKESFEAIEGLRYTPSAAFGSCRKKLGDIEKNRHEFERIIQVFKAHKIRYFFYNGGNDSMDTAYKISLVSKEMSYEIISIGVPKTVDNDLPITDNTPGYGSVAKYNAVSIREGSFDVESMHRDSTKVFLLESMGRNAGWIVGSTGLAAVSEKDGPHIILFPERTFNQDEFLGKVDEFVSKIGYIVVAVSEGVHREDGSYLADSGLKDGFGHKQLGGAALILSGVVAGELSIKTHTAILDYCQRSGRHIASKTDVEQAIACGTKAVELAAEDKNGFMPVIFRESNDPYDWSIGEAPILAIANQEKKVPSHFIRDDGYHITDAFREYAGPLIAGEDYPPYKNGLPNYVRLKKVLVPAKI
jgi:6-phosphofructokinase